MPLDDARRASEDVVKPHVLREDVSVAYAQMAADERREAEAEEWADALLADASDARAQWGWPP